MSRLPQQLFETEHLSFADGPLRGLNVQRKILGHLDEELGKGYDHAYFLAPKNYCVYKIEEGEPKFKKLRGKGVQFTGNSC